MKIAYLSLGCAAMSTRQDVAYFSAHTVRKYTSHTSPRSPSVLTNVLVQKVSVFFMFDSFQSFHLFPPFPSPLFSSGFFSCLVNWTLFRVGLSAVGGTPVVWKGAHARGPGDTRASNLADWIDRWMARTSLPLLRTWYFLSWGQQSAAIRTRVS